MTLAASLAASSALALLFALLRRHDPRPYLREWTAAWVVQGLAAIVAMVRKPARTPTPYIQLRVLAP